MAGCLPDIEALAPDDLKGLVLQLLEDVVALKAENAALREEIARLKGLKGPPKLKPSGMEKATEPARAERKAGRRGGKIDRLVIDEERVADRGSLEGTTYGSGWLSEAASPSFSAAALIVLVNVALIFRTLFAFLAIDPGTGGLFFFGDDPAPQLVAHLFFPVSQAWTLDIEFLFYLMAPFLVRRGLPALMALTLAFFALRLGIRFAYQDLFPTTWELKLYFTPFPQIGFFMAGAVSHWFYQRWKEHLPKGPGLVLLCVVATLTMGFFFLPLPPSWTSKIYYLVVFLSLPLIFESTRHSRLDRWIGETSYPIYVGHYIVVLALDGLGYSLADSGPAALIGATALAALLIVTVSAPLERYRQGRVSGAAPPLRAGNR